MPGSTTEEAPSSAGVTMDVDPPDNSGSAGTAGGTNRRSSKVQGTSSAAGGGAPADEASKTSASQPSASSSGSATGAGGGPPPPPQSSGKGGRRGGAGSRSISPAVPGSSASAVVDAVLQASLGQASALLGGWGYHGLSILLASHLQGGGGGGLAGGGSTRAAGGAGAALASSSAEAEQQGGGGGSGTASSTSQQTSATATTSDSSIIPSRAAVNVAATKSVTDNPPWVHWSKTDMAPQLKAPYDNTYRTYITQQILRGYRMARASHGVTKGCYYYECVLLDGPTAKEILAQLPSNARLGPGLQELLSRRAAWEQEREEEEKERQQQQQEEGSEDKKEDGGGGAEASEPETSAKSGRKRKHEESRSLSSGAASSSVPPPRVGGHVRLGWSMRTGDLQAPVGYDKWSYGIRDIGGSLIHKSERQDHWGGMGFEPGDVIGCAIALYDTGGSNAGGKNVSQQHNSNNNDHDDDLKSRNHVRFFKNGECMGHFVVSKGKREGGEAFTGLDNGTYYPAVSSYMGGSVEANFGPHWVYPPRKLPQGLKFQPLCDLCPSPLNPEAAVQKCLPAVKLFRKVEHQNALKEAIMEEAKVLCDTYDKYWRWHVSQLRKYRTERGLTVQDLPVLNVDGEQDAKAAPKSSEAISSAS